MVVAKKKIFSDDGWDLLFVSAGHSATTFYQSLLDFTLVDQKLKRVYFVTVIDIWRAPDRNPEILRSVKVD
jgi:hypothetical protein